MTLFRALLTLFLATSVAAEGLSPTSQVTTGGGASGGLTDAQLRATPVPVSGSLTIGAASGATAVTSTFTQTVSTWTAIMMQGGAFNVVSTATTISNAFGLESTLGGVKTGTDRIPAQGQALAAASLPVVLTAAQVTTLTPPAAITNFANETGGNLATLSAKDFATQTTLSALNAKVTAVNTGAVVFNGAQPVSGTFFQAVQPVSPTLTGGSLSVTSTNTAVTGTFFQALQPVTLTNGGGALSVTSTNTAVTGTFWQAIQPVTPTLTGGALAVTSTAAIVMPTLTKGTQGATGISTQDLKDAGRVLKTYATLGDTGITGVVATTLVTMTPYADLTAGTPATTFAVTSGKRLRLQQMCVTWRNNTAVVGAVTVRLRTLAGTVLVGSPIQLSLNASTLSAVIGSGQSNCASFPDGFELSGTMQFGVTQQAQSAVAGFSVEILGYEY